MNMKTDIGIAYKEYGKWKVVPINSKVAKKKEPEVVKMVYDTFKLYPTLEHEIEKREINWRKKKSVPAFSGSSYKEMEMKEGERIPYLVAYPSHASKNPLALAGSKGGRVLVFDVTQKEIDKINDDNRRKGVSKQIKKEDLITFSILHELKHEDQGLRTPDFSKQQSSYDRYKRVFEEKYRNTSPQDIYKSKEAAKLYYEENPYEKEALEYSLKKLKEMRKR